MTATQLQPTRHVRPVGPVDVLVIAFPDLQPDGSIAEAKNAENQAAEEEQAELQQQQQQQSLDAQAAQQQAAAPPGVADMDDKLAKLKELAGLHDQGVLTDEEIAAQKAKILG